MAAKRLGVMPHEYMRNRRDAPYEAVHTSAWIFDELCFKYYDDAVAEEDERERRRQEMRASVIHGRG